MKKIIKKKRAGSKEPPPPPPWAVAKKLTLLGPAKLVERTERIKPADGIPYFLTTQSDGVKVGWDTCGQCHRYVYNCRCRGGVSIPDRVVKWFPEPSIYEQAVAAEKSADRIISIKRGKAPRKITIVKEVSK